MRKKNNFLIDVIEWCVQKPGGFTHEQLSLGFKFEEWQKGLLDNYFEKAINNFHNPHMPRNETLFHVIKGTLGGDFRKDDSWKFVLNLESLFNYYDYAELKFARENAEEARGLANKSIKISHWALYATIAVGLAQILMQGFDTFYTPTPLVQKIEEGGEVFIDDQTSNDNNLNNHEESHETQEESTTP